MSNAPDQPSGEKPEIYVDEDWKSQVQAEKEAAQAKEQAHPEPQEGDAQEGGAQQASGQVPPLPPASFSGLVSMLATQATMAMGQAADDSTEKAQVPQHLNLAKHCIDSVAILQEKTKGNLAPEEAQMVEGVLHELRMAFLSVKSR